MLEVRSYRRDGNNKPLVEPSVLLQYQKLRDETARHFIRVLFLQFFIKRKKT
jgi:hypothetical protein